MSKLISIVMGYYNRKNQLIFTLDTINRQYKNFNFDIEIIIVDDGSNNLEKLDDVIYKYPFKIKLIVIQKEDKKWINPVISYNVGIKNCSGDIIIFQNPEVCHIGNIIQHVLQNITDEIYLVYSVLSLPGFEINEKLKNDYMNMEPQKLIKKYCSFGYVWYIHPKYHNRRYHFLSAMTRKTLEKIGGFDPDFYDGYCYDDDDFRNRIEKVVKSITIHPDENLLGVHLFHETAVKLSTKDIDHLTKLNIQRMNDNIKNNIVFCDINKLIPNHTIINN